uniref:non-specific serine/threonine protein kinase n=1 Tax=Dermatophagoides pteronyssinus TaxID=6956 RepID=A0A6P6XYA9_DERPT|nr:eukaryotic translation initiation factor 2-alpha kinase 1-like [Dermatophagoides pteronyssinus]
MIITLVTKVSRKNMNCQIRFNNENIETCFLFPIYDSSLPLQLRFQMDPNNNNYHHQHHNQSQINNVNVDEEIVHQLPEALPITDFDDGTMEKSTNKMTMSTKQWEKIFDKDDKILNQSIITTNNNVDNKVVRRNRNRAQNLLFIETLVEKVCFGVEPNPILPHGKVNKVQHRVDKQQYAVKIIYLKKGKLTKFTRETRICAKLSHPNIVIYKTSWIQKCLSSTNDDHNDDESTISENSKENVTVIESYGSKNVSDKIKSKFFKSSSSSSSSSSLSSSIKKIESKINVTEPAAFLFMQMELCGQNLKDYIVKRNDSKTTIDKLDLIIELKWFEQILAGVQYMHKNNFIHRDLKPSNILFTLDGKYLKICDFGLSSWILQCNDDDDQMSTSSSSSSLKNDKQKSLSFGMGTTPYAAPEQLAQSNYDHRVDIYSLGIILFELVYPFGSEMEKSRSVKQLKESRCLPNEFEYNDRYGKLGQLILDMTENNAKKRIKTINLIEKQLSKIRSQFDHRSSRKNRQTYGQLRDEISKLKIEKQKDADKIAKLEEEIRILKQGEQNKQDKKTSSSFSKKVVNFLKKS